MFHCKCCNYSTPYKTNYNRHLKSKKHILKDVTNDVYICKYCNSKYNRLDSLQRHLTKCIDKKSTDKDNIIEDLKKEKQELKKTIEILTNKIDVLIKEKDKLKDNHILTLSKTLNKTIAYNNNVTQIIINNYPNAPNLSFPMKLSECNLKKYIQMGCVQGYSSFIQDNYVNNILPHDRSIWLVDRSRNKFIIKYNDAWVIDIDGLTFQELTVDNLYKMTIEYMEINNKIEDDLTKTLEFICDLKTKSMVIKGLKCGGKYLVYDKSKYNFDNDIVNQLDNV